MLKYYQAANEMLLENYYEMLRYFKPGVPIKPSSSSAESVSSSAKALSSSAKAGFF
jgi:hypothetical protein